jgi:Fur family transcriptional regulator, ferric uptake regulator
VDRRFFLRRAASVLFGTRAHRSAEELTAEVQAQAPDVNISTIYRNLEELVRVGVVDRAFMGNSPASYHLASVAHSHLVYEQCGSMTEAADELLDGLARGARERYGV